MNPDFAQWLRHSAPYIRAHRGETFVIVFGGEAMRSRGLVDLVHDVALLHSLGVRLVLVAGSRPQIERRLEERGLSGRMHEGVRITDAATLQAAKEAAGVNRVELERLLTTALPGSPMAGARVRVAAGNFVTAKPLGVIDGVDHEFTGRVRRIDAAAIRQRLDDDAIVILTPLGYSLTGEAFNLSTPELAADTAIAIGAAKLVALVEGRGLRDSELTASEAEARAGKLGAELKSHVLSAARAVRGGVRRAHLVRRKEDGALLRELFTREGIGTLVTETPTEAPRPGRADDVPRLLELLGPLEAAGQLVRRPREVLEEEIDSFLVIERDGFVLACAQLRVFQDEAGELACVAVDPEHRTAGRGEAIVHAVEKRAREVGLRRLVVLTTQSTHWFQERGYIACTPSALPAGRPRYDRQRRSKILCKTL